MKPAFVTVALIITCAASSSVSWAADGAGGTPAAAKEGGIAGDPRGAIRALGGNSHDDFKQKDNKVRVPPLGGGPGVGRVDGPPPGTTGPR